MKHLRKMERTGLVFAIVLIVFGIYSIVNPTEGDVYHPDSGVYQRLTRYDSLPERVTKSRARIYGFVSAGLGASLAFFVLYRPRR